MTWNCAGGLVIFSHDRQVNFSRTVWITFHCRGTTSSVSVMVSPSLASCRRSTGRRSGRDHHPLARQMRRKRRAHRLSAGERAHRRARGRCRGGFVLGRVRRGFLELQFQLVEQLAAALGGMPVLLAPQLGDQQLQVRHIASAPEARASACSRGALGVSAAFSAAIRRRGSRARSAWPDCRRSQSPADAQL